MSTRPSITVLVGAAFAAVLLAGCSSSGSISGSGSQGSAVGGTGGVPGSASGSTPAGASGGNGSVDKGCAQAMTAIQDAEKAQNNPNPQDALQEATTDIGQIRAAAATTKKPGGQAAMNKVADDLQTIVNEVAAGQKPDTSQALDDGQEVVRVCG